MRLFVGFVFFVFHSFAFQDIGAVHEWGTFTSVAGENGRAVRWTPLAGSSDLPQFVHTLGPVNLKLTDGMVRMETPVLYFYPLKPAAVSVHVDFPYGRVTEWYPRASGAQPPFGNKGWIEWKDLRVGETGATFPREAPGSHYYAARETDSRPVEISGEKEKFLFYRGMGDFEVDVQPVVNGEGVTIRNVGAEAAPVAILFENHRGKIGYRTIRGLREPVSIKFAELSGGLDSLRARLEDELTEMGLYRKEAHAMLETWRDSWFEEGLRVIYILPRATVDRLLPLSITPAPSQLSRVFVGRVELLSPWMRQEIASAPASGNIEAVRKYGRFLNAFLFEIGTARVH